METNDVLEIIGMQVMKNGNNKGINTVYHYSSECTELITCITVWRQAYTFTILATCQKTMKAL